MKIKNPLIVKNKDEWQAWLRAHHASEKEVWLVYFKPASGRKGIDYEESVEEALCFGWIDSIIQRIDEAQYARKFNPRREGSNWSASNKSRMEKLIRSGRMTPAGLAAYNPEARESSDDYAQSVRRGEVPIPLEITRAIKKNAKAWKFFSQLPPSQQRQASSWVASAKKEETRQKRLQEVVDTFAQGKKLGLK
jgi:uncharacterized protein YdeI (YjbR/CyaY-like superfamily)